MKKFSIVSAMLLVFAIISTACAGGGAGGVSTSLKVDMSEFSFAPTSFSVPAGKEITLELKNSGSIRHDFIILKKGVVLPGKFDAEKQMDDVYFHAVLDSGKAQTFTFMAPSEAGEYQVICGIAGHFQAGMTATLIVK